MSLPAPGRGIATSALIAPALVGACLRIGEPTPSAALVTWAAYPETVRAGGTFSFEFAGPVALDACGRLDTATLTVDDSTIRLGARRSTFQTLCADQRVSFYEARPLVLDRPGRYSVHTDHGARLGALIVTDSGPFSAMRTIGEGTIRSVADCVLFGPGWAANQRPFALSGAPHSVRREAGTDRVVHVEGTLVGFTLCGWYGSRPRIRVDTAWVTERRGSDFY